MPDPGSLRPTLWEKKLTTMPTKMIVDLLMDYAAGTATIRDQHGPRPSAAVMREAAARLRRTDIEMVGQVAPVTTEDAERLARNFSEFYEALAPRFGHDEPALPWEDVLPKERALMVETARAVMQKGRLRLCEVCANWEFQNAPHVHNAPGSAKDGDVG